MRILKIIVFIEFFIIVFLTITSFTYYYKAASFQNQNGLLSPGIYTGALTAQSRLLFNFAPLESSLNNYIGRWNNKTVGVYISNLRDGASIGINEEEDFEPASLNKLPLAILTMREIEKGQIGLDTKFKITPEDIDSASGTLYLHVGEEITVANLLKAMLSDSDNTAFAILFKQIDSNEWETLSDYLNYYEIKSTSARGKNIKLYTVSPIANSHIFSSLYLSTLLEPEHSEYILSLLTNSSRFDVNKVSNIPENITIAQKFGEYYGGEEKYFHSCGIMYLNNGRFFYCVMTKGASKEEAQEIIGEIVHQTYEYIISTRKQVASSAI